MIFFLFPKLKGVIKETRFPDVEVIKRAVTMELRRIPEEAFRGVHQSMEEEDGQVCETGGKLF